MVRLNKNSTIIRYKRELKFGNNVKNIADKGIPIIKYGILLPKRVFVLSLKAAKYGINDIARILSKVIIALI